MTTNSSVPSTETYADCLKAGDTFALQGGSLKVTEDANPQLGFLYFDVKVVNENGDQFSVPFTRNSIVWVDADLWPPTS